MIDKFENFVNSLTDMDWGWWPVLFLRPPKEKDIDNLLLLKLTLIYGSTLGVILSLLNFWMEGAPTLVEILFFFLLGGVLFFLVFKFISAYFWNRRARRLRGV